MPEVKTSKIEVYHLDRFPGNSSTHSPIFSTVEFESNKKSDKLTAKVTEGLESPFRSYLTKLE